MIKVVHEELIKYGDTLDSDKERLKVSLSMKI